MKKYIKILSPISIFTITTGIVPVLTLSSCSKKETIKVIIDTDVGNDCDDIAALSVIGNAYQRKMVDVKAVTVTNDYAPSLHTTDIILEQYGIDCPIAKADDPVPLAVDEEHKYVEAVDNKWVARSAKDPSRIKLSTPVLRQALADAEKGGYKIKLITLGPLNNINALITSPGDNISPKSGKQLFEDNVSQMVLMAGNLVNQEWTEFNITQRIANAQTVINTTSIPKTFVDWTVGKFIYSGLTFYANPDSPQCTAYWEFTDGDVSRSFDPLTVYIALNGAWGYSNNGTVTVDDAGHTLFAESPNGKCRYVLVSTTPHVWEEELENWYTIGPKELEKR